MDLFDSPFSQKKSKLLYPSTVHKQVTTQKSGKKDIIQCTAKL